MFAVSIILACHNVEDYIGEAFASLERQSAFRSFEIIPVDDGSTDGTRTVIERFRERHPENVFPICFDTASGAPGRPRNAGIEQARGRYLIFMDPDDRVNGDGYSVLLAAIEKHGSDIVIAARHGVPPGKGPEYAIWTDFLLEKPFVNDDSYRVRSNLLLRRPGVLKSIYRAPLIRDGGIRFAEDLTSSEDEIFDMRCVLSAKRLTKINDIVYLATIGRTESLTSKIGINLWQQLPRIMAEMDDALLPYFGQAVVSYRIISLIRNFYLPKLLRLEPALVGSAIDLVREACAGYGLDRLRESENAAYQKLVETIATGDHTQILLYVLNQQVGDLTHKLKAEQRNNRRFSGRAGRGAAYLALASRAARQAVRDGEVRKYVAANLAGRLGSRPNDYWIFGDRVTKAGDNAEALYRHVRDERLHDRIAFVLDPACPDWARLRADGFKLVAYGTLAHWRLLHGCEHFFTSHVDDMYITPWKGYGRGIRPPRYKLTFLQHGIIRSDLSGWLGSRTYHVFCASARSEYDTLLKHVRYGLAPDVLRLTGLARHDLLARRDGDYLLVAPTWRSFLDKSDRHRFEASEFCRSWSRLLTDERLLAALEVAGLRIKFLPHPRLEKFRSSFPASERVEVLSPEALPSYAELLSGAQALITDYSSISFDALYLRRPVVYYAFAETQLHDANIGAKDELYASLGQQVTEHDEAVEAITALIGRGFKVDEDRLTRIGAFFPFQDDQNRRRILAAALGKELTR